MNTKRHAGEGSLATTDASYRIGDLAREFDVTLRTLRFYEDKGLIRPFRRGTTRIYSAEDREQLKLALFCKRIGLPLKQIRKVLDARSEADAEVRSIYRAQVEALAAERERLAAAASELQDRLAGLEATQGQVPQPVG